MTRATGRLGRRAGPPPGSTDPLAAGSPIGRVGAGRRRAGLVSHHRAWACGVTGAPGDSTLSSTVSAMTVAMRVTAASARSPAPRGRPRRTPAIPASSARTSRRSIPVSRSPGTDPGPGNAGMPKPVRPRTVRPRTAYGKAWGWPPQHVRGADGTEGREDPAEAEQPLEVPRPLARVDIHSLSAPGVRDPQGPLPLGRAGLELLQVAARAGDDHRRSTVGPFLAVPVPALTLDLRIGIPPGCRWHSLKPLLVLPAAPLPRLLPGPTLVGPLINGRPRHAHSRSIGPRTSRSADATRGERRRGGRSGVVDVDDSLIGAMSRA